MGRSIVGRCGIALMETAYLVQLNPLMQRPPSHTPPAHPENAASECRLLGCKGLSVINLLALSPILPSFPDSVV